MQALAARAGRIQELAGKEGWAEDADAVHDVRVASRRLRTALELSDPAWVPGWARQRRRARALTRALGATRELDVHGQRLASLAAELPDSACHAVLEHLLEDLERKTRKARRRMARRLARTDVAGLGILSKPASPADAEPVSTLEARLAPLLGGGLRTLAVQEEDPPALHRLRIETKMLRYAVEILGPGLGPEASHWIRQLKALQEALGDHHDWFTLETLLWDYHAQLTVRRRPVLAAGVLDLLGCAVEHRRAAFETLPEAAAAVREGGAMEGLPSAVRAVPA